MKDTIKSIGLIFGYGAAVGTGCAIPIVIGGYVIDKLHENSNAKILKMKADYIEKVLDSRIEKALADREAKAESKKS